MSTEQLRRAAATLTIAGAGAHVVLAVLYLAVSPFTALFLGAMAGWCVHCAVQLWRSASVRTWVLATGSGLGMIALHLGMMTMPHGSSAAGHHHAASVPEQLFDPSGFMTAAMVAGVVAEAVLIVGAIAEMAREAPLNYPKCPWYRGAVRQRLNTDIHENGSYR